MAFVDNGDLGVVSSAHLESVCGSRTLKESERRFEKRKRKEKKRNGENRHLLTLYPF